MWKPKQKKWVSYCLEQNKYTHVNAESDEHLQIPSKYTWKLLDYGIARIQLFYLWATICAFCINGRFLDKLYFLLPVSKKLWYIFVNIPNSIKGGCIKWKKHLSLEDIFHIWCFLLYSLSKFYFGWARKALKVIVIEFT